MSTLELAVRNMSCSSCVTAVTRVLQRIDGVAGVDVDLKGATVRVQPSPAASLPALEAALVAALDDAGYPATVTAPATPQAGAGGCGGSKGCCCGR
jgi:copper chaperone CopZ